MSNKIRIMKSEDFNVETGGWDTSFAIAGHGVWFDSWKFHDNGLLELFCENILIHTETDLQRACKIVDILEDF